jgi:DNA-binding LacI/PurR family transcriptional regulator
MSELLAREVPFSAVFVGSMLAAVGAINAAFHRSVPVPDRLSVIGFHDAPLASYLRPALTVVRMPTRELGLEAVRLLLGRLDGGPHRQQLVRSPQPEIVRRESTAAPRRADR